MNKSDIQWTDYTWNPLTGCLHNCSYCYARRLANNARFSRSFPNGFKPTVHKNRLNGPGKVKKPATVFVGSMCDMMGAWWHPSDIQAVIDACEKYSQHTFLWLTKNPSRYSRFTWPDNCYLGITVTKHLDLAQRAPLILDVHGVKRFISYEPMHNHLSTVEYFKPGNFIQVICGPENGPGKGPDLSQDEFEMQLHINLDCKAAGIDIYNKHDSSGTLYWPVKGSCNGK